MSKNSPDEPSAMSKGILCFDVSGLQRGDAENAEHRRGYCHITLRFSPPDRMAGLCELSVSAMKNTL